MNKKWTLFYGMWKNINIKWKCWNCNFIRPSLYKYDYLLLNMDFQTIKYGTISIPQRRIDVIVIKYHFNQGFSIEMTYFRLWNTKKPTNICLKLKKQIHLDKNWGICDFNRKVLPEDIIKIIYDDNINLVWHLP